MGRDIKQQANIDVRLTIDSELQKEAVAQLKGRHGAVVVLNPQTGELLAMYSNPSYSLKEVQDEETWIRLERERARPAARQPRARADYIPGSTFKTAIMLAAFNSGLQGREVQLLGRGLLRRARRAKPIFDSGGTGEVHGSIGIDTALRGLLQPVLRADGHQARAGEAGRGAAPARASTPVRQPAGGVRAAAVSPKSGT